MAFSSESDSDDLNTLGGFHKIKKEVNPAKHIRNFTIDINNLILQEIIL